MELVAKLRGYKLTCVMPANATPERRLVLELYGATIIDSPANEGSNGAVRLAQELAAADDRYVLSGHLTPGEKARGPYPRSPGDARGRTAARQASRADME